jgi:hypothetical protein
MFRSDPINACEAIDRAVTIDLPGYGLIPKLYSAAREKSTDPLAYSAGKALGEAIRTKNRISVITGFPVLSPFSFPGKPAVHSDGPVGVAALLAVLVGKFSLDVNVITDSNLSTIIKTSFQDPKGTGWTSKVSVIELPPNRDVTPQCEEILSSFHPSLILGSEKPGHNRAGEYHTAGGKSLTPYISRSDVIFNLAKGRNIPTIAIGDLGNDAGMGNIEDGIRKAIPSEAFCNCPCKSGIISNVTCDHLVVGTMCDWGLYGLLACIAIEFRDLSIVPTRAEMMQVMKSFATASQLSDEKELMTDGIPFEYSVSCLETLRGIVQAQLMN